MSHLRALLPVPVAQPVDGVLLPASTGPRSLRPAGSAEFVGKSPRTTRHAKRRVQLVRVMETSVWGPSSPHASGSFGCPGGGGLRLSASVATGVSGSEWYWPVGSEWYWPPAMSASVGEPPNENGLSISGGGGTQMDWSSRGLGLLH